MWAGELYKLRKLGELRELRKLGELRELGEPGGGWGRGAAVGAEVNCGIIAAWGAHGAREAE